MKACILVGGCGTRLRPLTFTKPKPLIPFCNVPMVLHQIVALIDAGVAEIIFLMSEHSEMLVKECEVWKQTYDVEFSFCYEENPLGTAGPLRLALEKGLLDVDSREPFFVLNSDIICDYPLRELLRAHKSSRREGTILLKKVTNWSQYGVVKYDEDFQVQDFIEKPTEFVGDRINAGIYVFQPAILKRIPDGNCSLERTIFPQVVAAKSLYCMEYDGIWKDIGNPIDFLHAVQLFTTLLTYVSGTHGLEFPLVTATDTSLPYTIIGDNIIDQSAHIYPDAVIGPNVTIAANCVIGKGVRIQDSVVLSDSTVHDFACVTESIIGWSCSIGRWAHCVNGCVLGKDVHVGEYHTVNGVRALPFTKIERNIFDPQIIM